MPKYTRIPADTFKQLTINAGLVLNKFDTKTGTVAEEDILFATSGGSTFTAKPSFTDYGDDIDNCPANMMELKRIDSWDVTLKGTALTVTPTTVASIAGAADIDGTDKTKVVPRKDLKTSDFSNIWWVGDYGTDGFIAVHLDNALSTGGLSIKADDKKKGEFDFEYTAHTSMSAQDTVPFEVYVSAGTTV